MLQSLSRHSAETGDYEAGRGNSSCSRIPADRLRPLGIDPLTLGLGVERSSHKLYPAFRFDVTLLSYHDIPENIKLFWPKT